MPREGSACQRQCVDIDGFSLHAAVRVDARDRKRLEQPCRYITRPATSDERVQFDAAGQLELERKKPWRDGSTHEVICPMELMQRLPALVLMKRLPALVFMQRLLALVPPQGPEVKDWADEAAAVAPSVPRDDAAAAKTGDSDHEPGRCWASRACDAHDTRLNPESEAAAGFWVPGTDPDRAAQLSAAGRSPTRRLADSPRSRRTEVPQVHLGSAAARYWLGVGSVLAPM